MHQWPLLLLILSASALGDCATNQELLARPAFEHQASRSRAPQTWQSFYYNTTSSAWGYIGLIQTAKGSCFLQNVQFSSAAGGCNVFFDDLWWWLALVSDGENYAWCGALCIYGIIPE
jgi:hypothetical protein